MNKHATDLKMLLKDPSLLQTRAYVAGEWIDADDGKTFSVVNPRWRTCPAPRSNAPLQQQHRR